MKKNEYLVIVFSVILSVTFSLILSNALIASPKNQHQQVEVVDKITTDFPQPGSKFFNQDSIDPTQLIHIGDNNNQKPFNGTPTQ